MLIRKVRLQPVHLADREWGHRIMDAVAREILLNDDGPEEDPLVVHVYEHAGWYLAYALLGSALNAQVVTIASANDEAVFSPAVQEFRKAIHDATWEGMPSIRRNDIVPAGPNTDDPFVTVYAERRAA